VPQELFDLIQGEAGRFDRTCPAQVRHVLRQHYGAVGDDALDDDD